MSNQSTVNTTMTVEVKVGIGPVARKAKATGNPYRGVEILGYHRPGYLPLAAARTLLSLTSNGPAFVKALSEAIKAAEEATIS